MHVPADILVPLLDVLVFKVQPRLVCLRYDEQVQAQREYCNQRGGEYIRDHHPVETDTTGKNRHYLSISSHLGCEENDRDENEQWAEHVHEVRDKIHIVIKYDGPQRCLLADKVINLLTDVEDDDDADDQKQRHKECGDELLDDIYVKPSWSEVKLHFLQSCGYPAHGHVLPRLEITGLYMLSRLAYKVKIECKVVLAGNLPCKYFPCDKKMPQVCL